MSLHCRPLALLIVLAACGGGDTPTEPAKPVVRSIQLTPDSIGATMGQTVTIAATLTADAGYAGSSAVLWRSSNADIASLAGSNGVFTARSPGVATITAMAAADTMVRRTAKVAVTGFMLSEISAGGGHTCGLAADGTAYCWGNNEYGQLGLGSVSDDVLIPAAVAGGLRFTHLATSSGSFNRHTCGIATDGDTYCWGINFNGSLGDGTSANRVVPTRVVGGHQFQRLAVGVASCGIVADGDAYCWGPGTSGQIGNGEDVNRFTPALVAGGLKFSAISTTDYHTCAVTLGGAAYCWGASDMLGNGGGSRSLVPAAVTGGLSFASIETARLSTCGLTTGGAVYCWGEISGTQSSVPKRVGPEQAFVEIAGAGWLVCGRTQAATVYCWGVVAGPLLGQGANPVAGAPVAGGLLFTSLTAGSEYLDEISQYACGTTSLGAVCWGTGATGSLGNGSRSDNAVPLGVAFPP
jgi:hypothetical protein